MLYQSPNAKVKYIVDMFDCYYQNIIIIMISQHVEASVYIR